MLPYLCPGCQSQLKVKSLSCKQCGTEVIGLYDLPALARLPQEDQTFILNFVKCSGSLKDMAKQMGLSYPTVRNLLDEIILKITKYEQ
ncbi:MAG: DUF2089 domain-containing protein [Dysgonamonadaceae bacterium]|nr:DUF2089 domain-containing protein [Dysgonamonadaceae bacterium]